MGGEAVLAFVVLLGLAFVIEVVRRHNEPRARALRTSRRARIVPTSQCREGDIVRVAGRVEVVEKLIHAPVSGAACVGYSLQVFRKGSRDASEPTIEVLSREEVVSFALRESGAVALVEPGEVIVSGTGPAILVKYGEAPETLRSLLAKRGYDRAEIGGNLAELICHEVTLLPADSVSVYGVAAFGSSALLSGAMQGESPFRGATRVLQFRGTASRPLVLERAGVNGHTFHGED